ncbi:MAG TPA: HAD hydrolase-like protein [Candidatus Binataceae bacterium]|nr:HAD hydrolase-like protein [Candidatus Binataceae bacterium]
MAENHAVVDFPDLWLFDFDRTLAILEPVVDWAQSRRELEIELRAAKLPPALLEELIAAIPRGNLPLYEALRARLLDAPATSQPLVDGAEARAILARASALIERHELAGVDRAAPLPGALALLRALRARRSASAVVTSNSSRTVARWLADHRAAELVSVVVGRDRGLALKPSPATVHCALALCEHRGAIFVGDSDADYRAARAAELRFIGIASDPERRAQLAALGASQPDLFDSPAAVAAAFGLL